MDNVVPKAETPGPRGRRSPSLPLSTTHQGVTLGCQLFWKHLDRATVGVGRGCCLWKEMEQLKPACSKLESLFPEWLFRREKTLSKSQPRKPAIARGTGSVAKKDCKTTALGSQPLVPSPAEPQHRAPTRVPSQTLGPGTQTPHLRCPHPAPGMHKDTTRVVMGLHSLQRDSPCGLLGAFRARVLELRSGGGRPDRLGAALCLSIGSRGQD